MGNGTRFDTYDGLMWQTANLPSCSTAHSQALKHPTLVELGCADSLWLPYLAQNYESDCYGVDFSELGCQLAQRNLALAGAEGTIICEDLFAFAKEHRTTFNFVYSMGLIEHFSTPHAILKEMYNLLKPGGTMLTIIPKSTRYVYTNRAGRESETSRDTQGYFTSGTGCSTTSSGV